MVLGKLPVGVVGWCDDKLPVPGRPTSLDNSRTRTFREWSGGAMVLG